MRVFDIIKNKRDGRELTKEEIYFFIEGCANNQIPDYQITAFCMAAYFRGLTPRETRDMTFAIRDSGQTYSFEEIQGVKVDKHSSGGVGDKTSLVVMPIVASLGVKVAKSCGRGLGHTGGTVDKLESFEGIKMELQPSEVVRQVNEIGIAIISQSKNLAPADKKLYALRDVTATVDSMPMIVASIMGKKLAMGDDCVLLDVKCGSGAFEKTMADSKKLAKLCVEIGKSAGKKMLALITDMDKPLGRAIGNTLEVVEAIETLKGGGPADFVDLCVTLASNLLWLAQKGTLQECKDMVQQSLADGSALETFKKMVVAQGGNGDCVDNPNLLKKAKFAYPIYAKQSGFIAKFNAEGVGVASLILGAGRNTADEKIDHSAGIVLEKTVGDYVKQGELIATLFTNSEDKIFLAEQRFKESVFIAKRKPKLRPLVLAKIK